MGHADSLFGMGPISGSFYVLGTFSILFYQIWWLEFLLCRESSRKYLNTRLAHNYGIMGVSLRNILKNPSIFFCWPLTKILQKSNIVGS